jgi:3'(2'), 5'-bisphosphate nucleotidase
VTIQDARLGAIPPGPGGLRAERTVAIEAVRSAARVCRAVRAAFDDRLAASKSDRSPVTVADLAAQVLVARALATAFPGDPLVAEEDATQLRAGGPVADAVARFVAAEMPGLDRDAIIGALEVGGAGGGPAGRWWTLDPVDGTKGFLRDEQYAIALALVEDGRPVLGVLGCPNLAAGDGVGALYVAERGSGAFELPLGTAADARGAGRRISVAPVADVRDARYAESVEAAHSAQDEAARVAERLGLRTAPLRMDSQAKYAVVARGDASIYLRIPHGSYRENVWDHAAGSIIVEEAGGVVSDVDGRPLDFTTGRRLTANRGILAAPAAIHGTVLDAVRAVVGSEPPRVRA